MLTNCLRPCSYPKIAYNLRMGANGMQIVVSGGLTSVVGTGRSAESETTDFAHMKLHVVELIRFACKIIFNAVGVGKHTYVLRKGKGES